MIFLDSSYLVALNDERDKFHSRAKALSEQIDSGAYGAPKISDYVFSETATVALLRGRNLQKTVEFCDRLLKAVEAINVDETVFVASYSLFREQREQPLSFVDSSIIALCRTNGIAYLATFDRGLKSASGLKIVD